jgi:hypothetical protein
MAEQMAVPAGTFMGYNRATGAPEFAQEVAAADVARYDGDAKVAPPAPAPTAAGSPPVGFHGGHEANVVTSETHELPGEAPPIAEVGPYN